MGLMDEINDITGDAGPGSLIGMPFLGFPGGDPGRRQREHEAAINEKNAALQREFAQMGIRWRVEDAKAAGLHPLAALGASGAGASPSYQVGADQSEGSPNMRFLRDVLGQSVSRAINTTTTPEEKAFKSLQLESMAIDNALKKKELDGVGSPGLPSNSSLGLHLLGQNRLSAYGRGGYVTEQPTVKSHASPGKPHQAAGEYTDFVYARTPTGLHPVPSKEMQEAIEDKFIPETLWATRNYLYPSFSGKTRRLMKPSLKEHPLPPGYDWRWKPSAAEWRPYKKGTRSLEFFFKE